MTTDEKRRLPVTCPSCGRHLTVRRLFCPACDTEVEGRFALPLLAALPLPDQEFVLEFVKQSGSLKSMARHLGVSYPTVRNRLDEVIDRLRALEEHDGEQ